MEKQSKLKPLVALLLLIGLSTQSILADVVRSGASTTAATSGGIVTSPILFPDGTAGAPSMSFFSDTDTGIYRFGENSVGFSAGGTGSFFYNAAQAQVSSGNWFAWSSGAIGSASDLIMLREAAANLQLGVDNTSGAAIDQILSAADAITNADISGGDLTIQSGAGMGTGAVSALIFQTPTVAASGANPQSLATRLTISSAGIVSGTGVGFETAENMQVGAAKVFRIAGRGKVGAGSDGVMILSNDGVTDFGRLQFGGTTSSFPSLKRSGTGLVVQLADDSAGAPLTASLYNSSTNCSSSAAPAVCSAAAAGSVVIAAAATTVTVNTTAVTANSQIFIQEDSSLGTKLGVTCNTVTTRDYYVTARTAATSFQVTASAAPVTNPACLSYFIVN